MLDMTTQPPNMRRRALRRPGRYPLRDGPMRSPVGVRLTDEQWQAVLAIVRERLGAPEPSSILRELIALGLEAYNKRK